MRNKISRMLSQDELAEAYFAWLYHLMLGERLENGYWNLMYQLFKTRFYWLIPNDDNRAADGIQFRHKFALEKFGTFIEWYHADCSVFEMLCGLAERMEDILENPLKPSTSTQWLMLLITNLGLDTCTDDNYSLHNKLLVEQRINVFLERKYNANGCGGLFPLVGTRAKDQRKVEIYYQLMKYIDESFDT